jgi:hypothetical protein
MRYPGAPGSFSVSVAVAFHTHGVGILNLMPLGIHPAAPVPRYRSFFKDCKAALASAFSRAQAFFLCIFPNDVDGLAVRKAEAGARLGRTAHAEDARQKKHAAFKHTHLVAVKNFQSRFMPATTIFAAQLFPAQNLHSLPQGLLSRILRPEDFAMFTSLPLPVRPPGNPRLPVFWLGVTAISLTLICLLHSGQPHAFAPPCAENPPPGQFFQQAVIHAVPAVGLVSEVRASGPHLRAAAAAWPGDAHMTTEDAANAGNASRPPHKKAKHESPHPSFSPQGQVFPQPTDTAAPSILVPGSVPTPAHDTRASTAKPGVTLALRKFFLGQAICTDVGSGAAPGVTRIGSQAPGKALEQRIGNGLGLRAVMPQNSPWQTIPHIDDNSGFALEASWRLDLPAEFWCAPYLRGQYFSFSPANRQTDDTRQYFQGQTGMQTGWIWRMEDGDSLSVYGGAGVSHSIGSLRFFREKEEQNDTRLDLLLGMTMKRNDKLSLNVTGGYSGGLSPGWKGAIGLRYNF